MHWDQSFHSSLLLLEDGIKVVKAICLKVWLFIPLNFDLSFEIYLRDVQFYYDYVKFLPITKSNNLY